MEVHLTCWQTETVVDQGAAVNGANGSIGIKHVRCNLLESRSAEGALEIGHTARRDPHRHLLPAQNIRQMNSRRSGCPQDCDIGHGYRPLKN